MNVRRPMVLRIGKAIDKSGWGETCAEAIFCTTGIFGFKGTVFVIFAKSVPLICIFLGIVL